MKIEQAIKFLKDSGIKVERPFTGVWFCNGQQVTESEMIRWAIIITSN